MSRVITRGMVMNEWLDDFLVRSMLAGVIMVVIAAPMGCLMVWQRLAFLGDTLGHAAVLGVGIGLMLQVKPIFGVMLIVIVLVVSLSRVSSFNNALTETTLAIISHTGLAAGIILLGFIPDRNINLEAILFGDLLAISIGDLKVLLITTMVLLACLIGQWRSFVAVSVSREIAQAEGIEVRKAQFSMYAMIALLVAIMIKVMGVLLIAAMLVIPTTSARLFSRGPEQMVVISGIFGLGALFGGLAGSYQFDWQTGPSIVVCATLLLLVSLIIRKVFSRG